MRYLQDLSVSRQNSSPSVTTMTAKQLRHLIVESARQVTGNIEQQVEALSSRLASLLPFDKKSLFGERYEHFFHEKRAIADVDRPRSQLAGDSP